jgi:hypothetical protein
MVPTAGLNDHATPVLALPATVAVNCWVCEAVSEVVEGVTETVTRGLRLNAAEDGPKRMKPQNTEARNG